MSKRYYLNGKLHDGPPPRVGARDAAWEHEKQRRDHVADIVQPYNADGSLNKDFSWLYPEQAELYKKRDH